MGMHKTYLFAQICALRISLFRNLAMVHYHANDTAQALVHQKKMVIINERVMGLDHHETAHSYVRLPRIPDIFFFCY